MLNPEVAKERLLDYTVPNSEQERKQRVAGLPAELRRIGYQLLSYDENGKRVSDWRKQEPVRQKALAALRELDTPTRIALFEALFPQLGQHVEAVRLLCATLPYQNGGFRNPHDPTGNQAFFLNWLTHLVHAVGNVAMSVTQLAAWTPYLGYYADSLGLLFAAVIDAGGAEGEEVLQILLESARGEHEIGAMGRHVTRGLLVCSRPEAWDFMEKMLLAAQWQEGLRQVILETVDEAHPEAFRRMLRVILDNDLIRFSATLRAADVWFGFQWEVASARVAHNALAQVLDFLEQPETRVQGLVAWEPQTVALALWTMAFDDALTAVPHAAALLRESSVERRFVGAWFLAQLNVHEARMAVLPALDDPDPRIAAAAYRTLSPFVSSEYRAEGSDTHPVPDMFERLTRLVERLPAREKELQPIVWPWMAISIDRENVANSLPTALGERSPKALLPYLSLMNSYGRGNAVEKLAVVKEADDEIRRALLKCVADTSDWVRERAFKALATTTLAPDEPPGMEKLLTRKATDLRRGVVTLLLAQSDDAALGSVERLLMHRDPLVRSAGLDMAQQLVKQERGAGEVRTRVARFRDSATVKTEAETRLMASLLDEERETVTLDNGLGLYDPAARTKPTPPIGKKVAGDGLVKLWNKLTAADTITLHTPAALACVKSLDALVHEQRETPITVKTYNGEEEKLLGDAGNFFPSPFPRPVYGNANPAPEAPVLPLREVWENWNATRPDSLRDSDGLELVRACALFLSDGSKSRANQSSDLDDPFNSDADEDQERIPAWRKRANAVLFARFDLETLHHAAIVQPVLKWLLSFAVPVGAVDFLLDACEVVLSFISPEELRRQVVEADFTNQSWRDNRALLGWIDLTNEVRRINFASWTPEQHTRLFKQLRWIDEPVPDQPRKRPALNVVLYAHQVGGATEADLLDILIGPRVNRRNYWENFNELKALSGRKLPAFYEQFPIVSELVERCRQRIIEVELERGDMPTAASRPALALRYTGGVEMLLRLLHVMGSDDFARTGTTNAESRAAVFSSLIRATFPTKTDLPETFAEQVRSLKIKPQRLIELAMYAPQWAGFVEHTLAWPEFSEGVWWVHAHTKDRQWNVEAELREVWTAQASERTPLSADSLLEGAVDVDWFQRVYAALGAERWKALDEAAKFASGGGGHKRAQLYADAMTGRLDKATLAARITDKRNQDALRALGLLPLPAKVKEREADLLDRYHTLQEFLRGSRKFGAQRQASEKLSTGIAMENLARTAGFPDPSRLEWAMEARAVADLAVGPMVVPAGGATISLSINALGKPEIVIARDGKILKAVPASAKKDPDVLALQERKRALDRQASRMRLSLEEAMNRGDEFAGAELAKLWEHPILLPMLRSLVFLEVPATAKAAGVAGYPTQGFRAVEDFKGDAHAVKPAMRFRLAHPHDLMQTEHWHEWQRDCFLRERVQPFKQVFRELYVPTSAEADKSNVSRRYDGHQVNPRQALALLGTRGWVSQPDEGSVRRTFHREGLTAWLTFFGGYSTPLEVEGLTVNGVYFTRKGEYTTLPLTDVPHRVFSEAMRDLDLAVSVAHQGGVDPEASASTVEMRESLLRETVALLKRDNVRFQGQHALIDGKLGTYTVHMGSGIVHRQPGGALCIVPVHSQHRGRLFLPFADDDPRTAEVVSKVLMLSDDTQIKDPIILEQILARR